MLVNALNEYTFGKSGYVYLVGKDGEILLHKDTDQIGKNALEIGKKDEEYTEVTNAVEKILANNSGTTEYKFKDNNYIVGYYGSSYFDGTVVMVTNVADFTTASSSALTNIIVIWRCAYVPDGAVLSAFCKEDNKAYHFYPQQTSFSRTGQPYRPC